MKTIVCCSFKGGTGKTTVCLNLAAALSKFHEKRVLLIDFDPQANLSRGLAFTPGDKRTMMPVLQGKLVLKEAIQKSYVNNLDIVVSNKYLTNIAKASELISDPYSHERLGQAIETVKNQYDYCFIDIPPSFGWLCQSAFYASQKALICTELSPYSVDVLDDLKSYLDEVSSRHPISILGVLLSFWNSKAVDNPDLLEKVENIFPNKIFQTRIRRDILVQRCIFEGKAIFDSDIKSRGAEDYKLAAEEFLKKDSEIVEVNNV